MGMLGLLTSNLCTAQMVHTRISPRPTLEPDSAVCVCSLALWPHNPPFPHPYVLGVTEATNWGIDYEHRADCQSRRGEGSRRAPYSGRDCNHAARKFDVPNVLLRPFSKANPLILLRPMRRGDAIAFRAISESTQSRHHSKFNCHTWSGGRSSRPHSSS
jgi:hypothetical protein